jgi:hypothetical protein
MPKKPKDYTAQSARRLRQQTTTATSGKRVIDAERLCHDPAMRWIVGGKAAHGYCVRVPRRR